MLIDENGNIKDLSLWGKIFINQIFPMTGNIIMNFENHIIHTKGKIEDEYSELSFTYDNCLDLISENIFSNIEIEENNNYKIIKNTANTNVKYFSAEFYPDNFIYNNRLEKICIFISKAKIDTGFDMCFLNNCTLINGILIPLQNPITNEIFNLSFV